MVACWDPEGWAFYTQGLKEITVQTLTEDLLSEHHYRHHHQGFIPPGLLASGSSAFWQWYAYLSHSTESQFRATVSVSCTGRKRSKGQIWNLTHFICQEKMPSGIFFNETIWRALHVTKVIILRRNAGHPWYKIGESLRTAFFCLTEIPSSVILSASSSQVHCTVL